MADEQQNGAEDLNSEKISESKVEAEESFLREIDEEEAKTQQSERLSAQAAPAEKKKESSFSSLYKSISNKPARKRSIDPILGVCFVVLILCSCVVLANTIVSEVTKNDNLFVEAGDTVEVDYTGCFNDFYGEDGYIVFDTSYKSIGTGESTALAWSFDKNKDYNTLSFEAGGTSVLTLFGNATIGHRIGDKIDVFIDKDNGYVLKSSQKGTLTSLTQTGVDTIEFTKSDFKTIFGYDAPTTPITGYPCDDTTKKHCPFGVSYDVIPIGDKLSVVNHFTNGGEYKFYCDGADFKYSTDNGGTIQLNGNILSDNTPGMVVRNGVWTAVFFDKTDPVANDSSLDYKIMYESGKSLETYGMDLYFSIEIKGIKKA